MYLKINVGAPILRVSAVVWWLTRHACTKMVAALCMLREYQPEQFGLLSTAHVSSAHYLACLSVNATALHLKHTILHNESTAHCNTSQETMRVAALGSKRVTPRQCGQRETSSLQREWLCFPLFAPFGMSHS